MIFSEESYNLLVATGKSQDYFNSNVNKYVNVTCGVKSMNVWRHDRERPMKKTVMNWRGKSYREVNRELSKQDWQYL